MRRGWWMGAGVVAMHPRGGGWGHAVLSEARQISGGTIRADRRGRVRWQQGARRWPPLYIRAPGEPGRRGSRPAEGVGRRRGQARCAGEIRRSAKGPTCSVHLRLPPTRRPSPPPRLRLRLVPPQSLVPPYAIQVVAASAARLRAER